jgi:hypothetical protein
MRAQLIAGYRGLVVAASLLPLPCEVDLKGTCVHPFRSDTSRDYFGIRFEARLLPREKKGGNNAAQCEDVTFGLPVTWNEFRLRRIPRPRVARLYSLRENFRIRVFFLTIELLKSDCTSPFRRKT